MSNVAIPAMQHRLSYSPIAPIQMMEQYSPNRGTVRNGIPFYLMTVTWTLLSQLQHFIFYDSISIRRHIRFHSPVEVSTGIV